MLKRLENHDTKEPSPVDTYSIEHIMPQKENMAREWKLMLGENWKSIHATWLHRLGNLTLTAYNSEYNARPFDEKKIMVGGFDQSAVRLNKYVREQDSWTDAAMKTRGEQLAARAMTIWPMLVVAPNILAEARERKLRSDAAIAAERKIEMSDAAAALYEQLRTAVNSAFDKPIEMHHRASIGYHGPEFFMEVLPRKRYLTLVLPLDYADVENLPSIVGDTSDWKFIVNAQYDGGVYLNIRASGDIATAMPLITRAFDEVCK